MLKAYYRLTKPGIIYGNLMTAVAGFLLGADGHINLSRLVLTALGTAFVIAAACTTNNFIDRDIDIYMARTKNRALVTNAISPHNALIFGAVLLIVGLLLLIRYTNTATVILGLIGFVSYVGLYTPSKRLTVHSTLIGSISGATPIAAGYTAATGSFTVGAFILFMIMVIWQMPHFYAIALYRKKDYAAAGLPVLAVRYSDVVTKKYILAYVVLFALAVIALPLFGYASFSFFVIMILASAYWLWQAIKGFKHADTTVWARGVFGTSLLVLLILSVALSLNHWLP